MINKSDAQILFGNITHIDTVVVFGPNWKKIEISLVIILSFIIYL